MHFRLIGDSKLSLGVSVKVNVKAFTTEMNPVRPTAADSEL